MITPMSQLPGTPELVRDYFDDFKKVARFYNGDYRSQNDLLARAEIVRSRNLPIAKLIPVLKEQNQRFGCGVHTLEKIDLLLERQACAVVTGQQTGLFGGPLFTLYKALTTIKLSQRLSRTCEGCYVPVFWLASDDHDFREANHISFVDKQNNSTKLTYTGHPLDSRIPVGQIDLAESIGETLHQLDAGTTPSEFKDHITGLLQDAYRAGNTFSGAFGIWMTALLKSFGIILIDASDARIKALGNDVFSKEIAARSPSTEQAIAASKELRDAGYHAQVNLNQNALNIFLADPERNTLEIRKNGFGVKQTGQTFSRDPLLNLVKERPEIFSPNVLLRPIYQDTLLPTVAYVAGPAESAYYAQLKGVYEAFDLPMPIIYPRKSVTLLESKIEKVLDNYALKVPDFWGNVEYLINDIAKSQLPEALEKRLDDASLSVNKNLLTLQDTVGEFDITLVNAVENVRGKIQGQMHGLEKKILQAYKKKNEVIVQQIHKAGNSLYPNGHLQERELNITPYLFKHGLEFVERLYEALDISNFDHQIIRI